MSPAPQSFATAGSLTVSAIGSVTVAADEAYVVVIPEMDYGPSGPEQLSEKDRDEIIANLEAIGLSEEDIEFEHLGRYEPTSISVEVEIDDLAAKGDPIVEAIEEVVRRSETFGLRFSLSEENCEQAVSLARREAVHRQPRKAADDLADALGCGIEERSTARWNTRCKTSRTDSPALTWTPVAAVPHTALLSCCPSVPTPEVEVSVGLQVSYDLH